MQRDLQNQGSPPESPTSLFPSLVRANLLGGPPLGMELTGAWLPGCLDTRPVDSCVIYRNIGQLGSSEYQVWEASEYVH
jgi:hypothetical protein